VKSIGRYRGEGHLWGWIRQIAASKALMRIRRNQVRETDELHEDAVAGGGATGGWGAAVPDGIDLERAFERLSETARAVVWLHDVEGYTHEDIAELMGRTVSFSKSQLARAHARLRGLLEAPGADR
jgi:RNA polymerase sigma-70 factor (ECF subfamily)